MCLVSKTLDLRSSEVRINERFNQLEMLRFDVFNTSATLRVFVRAYLSTTWS